MFQEEEQKKLELEMQKRRERIERWRAERKKKEVEAIKKEIKNATLSKIIKLCNNLKHCINI